jgi:hypothetical protein
MEKERLISASAAISLPALVSATKAQLKKIVAHNFSLQSKSLQQSTVNTTSEFKISSSRIILNNY